MDERRPSTSKEVTKQEVIGQIGVTVVCCAMLSWAIFGEPPYGFFDVMRWTVAAGLVWSGWLLYRCSAVLVPFSLLNLGVAALHLLGELKRDQWVPFNWAAIGALVLASVVLVIARLGTDGRRRRGMIRLGKLMAVLATIGFGIQGLVWWNGPEEGTNESGLWQRTYRLSGQSEVRVGADWIDLERARLLMERQSEDSWNIEVLFNDKKRERGKVTVKWKYVAGAIEAELAFGPESVARFFEGYDCRVELRDRNGGLQATSGDFVVGGKTNRVRIPTTAEAFLVAREAVAKIGESRFTEGDVWTEPQ